MHLFLRNVCTCSGVALCCVDVEDLVTHCWDRRSWSIIGINSLAFSSSGDEHFRLATIKASVVRSLVSSRCTARKLKATYTLTRRLLPIFFSLI